MERNFGRPASWQPPATAAVVAVAVTVVAALVEAVLSRRWLIGAGTALAPVVAAAIILTALYERSGFLAGGHFELPPLVVFVLVLLGVAVREVWSRVIAPRILRGARRHSVYRPDECHWR